MATKGEDNPDINAIITLSCDYGTVQIDMVITVDDTVADIRTRAVNLLAAELLKSGAVVIDYDGG